MYQPDNAYSLEKYSSAVSLSDMEVFLFPELIYSLTLANIMSPLIWSWRSDPWFKKIDKMNQYRKVQRIKQFIMDRFTFNLDLETWGLTTKERELQRFESFIDKEVLARSNALFGYEGDKYYFDIDIRRHFGLDRYTSDVIPYWKTETVEAMEAFKNKPGYPSGAGECVSLAALYAASLFVLGGIDLRDIFLMATPLHSQNFVLVRDGIITNNRRIVTKNMWFNGTEISAKARRALQNERVTIVANNSGYVHTMYSRATMDRTDYTRFNDALRSYLKSDITWELLCSFLRQNSSLQKFFQFEHACCGKPRYIEMEKIFAYEHGSKSRMGDTTQDQLIHEIEEDEFYPQPLEHRIMINEVQDYFSRTEVNIDCMCNIEDLKKQLHHNCYNVEEVIGDLFNFCKIEPRLPHEGKNWQAGTLIDIRPGMHREQIIDYLQSIRATNETADLAFYAFRDLSSSGWKPFIKAAFERNPVICEALKEQNPHEIFTTLQAMNETSIYSGNRLAQPDEVWNFHRGDGYEKAVAFATLLYQRGMWEQVSFSVSERTVQIGLTDTSYAFTTLKDLPSPRMEDFIL
jgi:hypothetical protein